MSRIYSEPEKLKRDVKILHIVVWGLALLLLALAPLAVESHQNRREQQKQQQAIEEPAR